MEAVEQNRRTPDPRMVVMMDVMQAMTSTLELDELLKRIVKAVTRVLPCEACILWLFDPENSLLVPKTIEGFSLEEVGTHSFRPGEGTIGTAFEEQRAVITNDLKKFVKFVKKGDVVDRIVSLLDVPMILEGRAVGVLDAANKIPGNDFSEADAELLFMLATQAAVAIGNARVHEEVRRKAYELEILHTVTRTIGTCLDANEVIRKILEQAQRFLGVDDCSVYVYQPQAKALLLAAATGLRESLSGKLRVGAAEGLIGYSAQTLKTVMVSGPDLEPYRDQPPGDYQGFHTAMASAMSLPNKLIGVVEIRTRDIREISGADLALFKTVTRQMAVFLEKANLYQTVQEIYLEVIKSLSEAVEAKDPETIGHCFRVSSYAASIARAMGLEEDLVEQIRVAAHLHDIGKIGVPESILLKPARLNPEEYERIKVHSEIGARILTPIEMFVQISELVRHHHERFDGRGYPDGLAGKDIPLGARILAVADSFEAMTWDRPYSPRRTFQQAMQELERCEGSQFDPEIVRIFKSIFRNSLSNAGL